MWRGASGGTPYNPASVAITGGTLSGVELGPFTGPSNVSEMRNTTNAQTIRVYNTTDAGTTNYERGTFGWSGNDLIAGAENGGTGSSARQLHLRSGASGAVRLMASTTTIWSISTAAGLIAGTDNTYDIGAAGATRPRNIYVGSSLFLTAPVTETGASRTIGATDNFVIANVAGTQTLTLGTATAGRVLWVRTIQAQLVVSASSNVVPLIGGSAGTAILPATDGAWAMLVGDGTNWQIMASSVV